MLQNRLNFWLITLSLLFFSYSTAVFVSSLFLLKTKPCFSINFAFRSLPNVSPIPSPYVEKVGFFKSSVKATNPKQTEREEVINFNNLVLKGTIICSECGHSIAILQNTKTGKTTTVSGGKEIDGIKILKVYPKYVILSKNGRKYVLQLFKMENFGSMEGNVNSVSTNVFKVKRNEISKEISSGNFLKYINIVPSTNPEGLRVNYIDRRSFIYKLGIKPGDIITSINDIQIRTPEDSFSAFEQLKSSDSITIAVIRNGKKVKLHYELE